MSKRGSVVKGMPVVKHEDTGAEGCVDGKMSKVAANSELGLSASAAKLDDHISNTATAVDNVSDTNITDTDTTLADADIAGAENSDTDITDADLLDGDDAAADLDLPKDPVCQAVTRCVAQSEDHRKVVSHIFGRNKACTRALPEDRWVKYCRKHYQRFCYRSAVQGNWNTNQLDLVRKQLQEFEDSGKVESWMIALRKAEQEALNEENATIAATSLASVAPAAATTSTITGPTRNTADDVAPDDTISKSAIDSVALDTANGPNVKRTSSVESDTLSIAASNTASSVASDTEAIAAPATPAVWERFLVPFLGNQKTYDDVRDVLDVIETEFETVEYLTRDRKEFPGIEFLPNFPGTKAKQSTTKTRITKPASTRKVPARKIQARASTKASTKTTTMVPKGFKATASKTPTPKRIAPTTTKSSGSLATASKPTTKLIPKTPARTSTTTTTKASGHKAATTPMFPNILAATAPILKRKATTIEASENIIINAAELHSKRRRLHRASL